MRSHHTNRPRETRAEASEHLSAAYLYTHTRSSTLEGQGLNTRDIFPSKTLALRSSQSMRRVSMISELAFFLSADRKRATA
jgi:hypothetical protein